MCTNPSYFIFLDEYVPENEVPRPESPDPDLEADRLNQERIRSVKSPFTNVGGKKKDLCSLENLLDLLISFRTNV